MKYPTDIGLPEKFSSWRQGQDKAVRSLLYAPDRFSALVLPTGSGKSLSYMAYAAVNDGRAVFLTSTRALQDQLLADFGEMGLRDIRGRSNYECAIDDRKTAETGVCAGGVYCPMMRGGGRGCDYFDSLGIAAESRLVATNYSKWLAGEKGGGLGYFPTVVADECHGAVEEISNFAAVEITEKQVKDWGVEQPRRGDVGRWGPGALLEIEKRLRDEERGENRKRGRELMQKIARLCRLSEEKWLWSRWGRGKAEGWRWDLIEPGTLAEDLLFRGARRVILVSASVRRKTLDLLGVGKDVKVIEQESTFPVNRRPTYYWPVARVGQKASAEDWARVWRAMDEVIAGRLDRKGLVHSVSFARAEEVVRQSRFRGRGVLLLHEKGRAVAEVLREFRARPAPCVLVSPSVGTGHDFAGSQAEYQIIVKVPFPDMTSMLVKVRAERDREYIAYQTMQTIVQMTGRLMRSAEDQGETVVLDANFGWLRQGHWDFAPRWFHVSVRSIDSVPTPPLPLHLGD